MGGLGPADSDGNYQRPESQPMQTVVLDADDLHRRDPAWRPRLIIGRSCPWAHRVWLMVQLRGLSDSIQCSLPQPTANEGRWRLDPSWLDCSSLLDLYRHCGAEPSLRATVPVLVDPGAGAQSQARLLGNDSSPLSAALNRWPAAAEAPDLAPPTWKRPSNDGKPCCSQQSTTGSTAADLLAIKRPMTGPAPPCLQPWSRPKKRCSGQAPGSAGEGAYPGRCAAFSHLDSLGKRLRPPVRPQCAAVVDVSGTVGLETAVPGSAGVASTCDAAAWRHDYFGALFPLNPGGIVPDGPSLSTLVNRPIPQP